MDNLNDIKRRFLNAGIVEQLIYINVGLFLLTFIFEIFKNYSLYYWLSIPADFNSFIKRPWSILTYGFIHASFIHLLGNLITLFYFGNLLIDYFTKKQLLSIYLLGTAFGGVLFMLGNYIVPDLYNEGDFLIGASAGVSAILIGISTYMPNFQMKFALIGYVKLWHIALIWLLFNIILITSGQNLGGNLAHLGGTLFGFLYIQQLSSKKLDIFTSIKKLFTKREKQLTTVHNSGKIRNRTRNKSEEQQKTDAILDKIGKSGYDSLSQEEKDFLFQQGKK